MNIIEMFLNDPCAGFMVGAILWFAGFKVAGTQDSLRGAGMAVGAIAMLVALALGFTGNRQIVVLPIVCVIWFMNLTGISCLILKILWFLREADRKHQALRRFEREKRKREQDAEKALKADLALKAELGRLALIEAAKPKPIPLPPPPPPTRKELLAKAKAIYDEKVLELKESGLKDFVLEAAIEKAEQNYLKEIEKIL